ncbi:MAG: methionine--tRNA ligase [Acidimicrobiales bacterium]|nr:MAG: methionine--tRNA ligase [Acidimicrobiales bacterium]
MADVTTPYYVTTPIYYVNDAPHIGHAYTTITADAVARWNRLLGRDVHFLTGTDEHGLKVQRAAEDNNCLPIEWADQTVVRFKDAWSQLEISNDDFIRTSEERHYSAVQKLLQACYDNGDVDLQTYEGLYCVSCEAYFNEADLDDGNCPIHGRPVEHVTEENYFFKLSRYEQALKDWYASHPDFVVPSTKRNEALGFINQGLEDFSISRTSIDWGIPLPWDPGHVTYVWFDALTNYITAAGYVDDPEMFDTHWPGIHLIGKDILRFHCVYWPAMLMSAGLAPPERVHVHGFLLVGGEKMSKTRLNQIAPGDLIEEFGVDGVRHHFLHGQTFGPDGDFSHEGMIARYNADLANNLGNLLSRVTTVVTSKCGGVGPSASPDSPLAAIVAEEYQKISDGWNQIAPSIALDSTWKIIHETNAYLESAEPWKSDPGPDVDAVLGDALEVLRIVSILASPAVPNACAEIRRRIGLDEDHTQERVPESVGWGQYPAGLPVLKGDPLFPRLK